ncbi:hypothetical protein HZB05_02895 [Candidatus Wolfebacteria bacterium]|nr:hypothetical protein [Candidatus Wolfebacteria bacterium]
MKNKPTVNRAIYFLLLVSILNFGLIFPEVSNAQIPVTDAAHIGVQVGSFIERTIRWIKEDLVKSIRDVVAKRFIDIIVDQTITWINGGGKPLFVGNWKALLKQAGDVAFDTLIKDVGLAGICAPFKFSLKIALLPVKKFPQRVECTLDKVVKNINGFYNDFKQGNWSAFSSSWQPQNNFYGQLIIANDELTARIASEQNAASGEARAGSGFLSVKKCAEYDEPAIGACKKTYGANDPACNRESPSYCLKYQTMTPGDSVGKSVASAITSDTQWAASIQSWTSALVNAVINKVATVGLAKIAPGMTSNDSYYPPDYNSLRTTELDQQKQFFVDDINKFINVWSAIKSAKQQTLDYAKQSIDMIQAILATDCLLPSETESYTAALNQYKGDVDGRLPIEIGVLQAKIDEAGPVKDFILGAADTSEDQIKIQQTYNAFSDKFSEDRTARDSGSARNAASAETANFKTALDNQKTKLKQCESSL